MGNESSCFTPGKHKPEIHRPQEGYAIENIQADRKFLADNCRVKRNDRPYDDMYRSDLQRQNQNSGLPRAATFANHLPRAPQPSNYFQQPPQNDPQDADSHYALGCRLYDKKKLGEAEQAFKRCLEMNPQHGDCH